jgi:serine protease Do
MNESNSPRVFCCVVSFLLTVLFAAGLATAQTQTGNATSLHGQVTAQPLTSGKQSDFLRQFNDSMEALATKAGPAVVQVLASGFGLTEDDSGSKVAMVSRQRSLGSGVIVDPDGYIMTNAHVVRDSQRIEVVLTPAITGAPAKTTYIAQLLGMNQETDLALLKIDAEALPFLPVDPHRAVHQGELVAALGSPQGLGNSITMGIVSAVDRQPVPEMPMVFIQTDAPINRGNSGGPLIDIDGYLVGINTFIFSSSGGSEGLGFAIPVRVVSFVYERLKKVGHVDRSEIGAAGENITSLLSEGLHLPVSSGVIIADVTPDGPAAASGLMIGDIVVSVDGKPINSLPQLESSLYLHPTDQVIAMEVLRGSGHVTLNIPAIAKKHEVDRLLDLVDPETNRVRRLGVLGMNVDERVRSMLPPLRIPSGVLVVAALPSGRMMDLGLLPGDVVHAVNGKPVQQLDDLQEKLDAFPAGAAVVLQIERGGGMDFRPFEMY